MDDHQDQQGVTQTQQSTVSDSGRKSTFNLSSLGRPKILIILAVIFIVVASLMFVLVTKKDTKKELASNQNRASKGFNQTERDQLITALKTDKNNPVILTKLIAYNSREGNRKGTEEDQLKASLPYMDRLLEVSPNDLQALETVGYAYETAGDYDKALEYYKRASVIDPASAIMLFRIGHALEFLGRREEAFSYYDRAYSIDPNNPLVLMARGNQLMSYGDPQGSYESFLKASNQPGINKDLKAEALTAAAAARGTQNNFMYISDTLKLSKEAVDTDPTFSPALATYGYTLYLTTAVNGDKNQAFDYVKRAISANPRISKNYLILSTFYRAQKNYAEAISYNKQAIDRADDDNTLLSPQARVINKGTYEYELAKTYYQSGKRELVMPTLRLAVQYNPYIIQTIKNDFSNGGHFTDLATNGEFISLITK